MQITRVEKSLIQVPADRHPFPLQLEHTALIVVDMQNDIGFYSLLLSDCCAAISPIAKRCLEQVEHQAAIDVILAENGAIGWVTTSDRLLSACPI